MLNPCANERHQDNAVLDLRKNGLCFSDSRLRFILGITAVVLGVLLIIAGLVLALTIGGTSVHFLLSGAGFLFLFLGFYLIRACQIEKRKQRIEKGLKAIEDSKKIKRETVASEIANLEKKEKEKDAIIQDLERKITDVEATAEKISGLYVAREELLRKKDECLRNREESIQKKQTLGERLELTKTVLSLMDEERALASQLNALESEKLEVKKEIQQLTIKMTSMVRTERDSLKKHLISDLLQDASLLEECLADMENKHLLLNRELNKLHGLIEEKSEKLLQLRKDKQLRKNQQLLTELLRSKENLKEEMTSALQSLDICKIGFPEDCSVEPMVLDPVSDEDLIEYAEEETASWSSDLLVCGFLNDRIRSLESVPVSIVSEAPGLQDIYLSLTRGADLEEHTRAMQDVSKRAIRDFQKRYQPDPEATEETLKTSISKLEKEYREALERESSLGTVTGKYQEILKDLDRARGCLCNIQRSLGVAYEGSNYREIRAELDRCNTAIQNGLSSVSSISDQISDNSLKVISASVNSPGVWKNINVICGEILRLESELGMLIDFQEANNANLQSLLQQSACYSLPSTTRVILCEELKVLKAAKADIIRSGSDDTVDLDGLINSKQEEIDVYDKVVGFERLILEVRDWDRNIRNDIEAKRRELHQAYCNPIFRGRNVDESLGGLNRETGVCLLVLDKLVQFCANFTKANDGFKCLQEDAQRQFMTSIINRNRCENVIERLKIRLESLSEDELLREEGVLLISQLSDQELEREKCLQEERESIAKNRSAIRTRARQVAKESCKLRKLVAKVDKLKEKQDLRIRAFLRDHLIAVPDNVTLEALSFDLHQEHGRIIAVLDNCKSLKISMIGDKKKLEDLYQDCLRSMESEPGSTLLREKLNRLESDIKTIEQNIALLDKDLQIHQGNFQLFSSILRLFKERTSLVKAQKLLKILQSELVGDNRAVKSGGLEKTLLDTVVALDKEQEVIMSPGGQLLHWEVRLEACEKTPLTMNSSQDLVARIYGECCDKLKGTALEIHPFPEDRSQWAAFLLEGMHTIIRTHRRAENNIRMKSSVIVALMSQLERRIRVLSDEEDSLKEELLSTEINLSVDLGEEDDVAMLEELNLHLKKQDALKKNLEESVEERIKLAEEFTQVHGRIRVIQDDMSGDASLFLVEEGLARLKEEQTNCFRKQQQLFSKMKELEASIDLITERQKSCSGRLQTVLLSEQGAVSLANLEEIAQLIEEEDFFVAEMDCQLADLITQIQVLDREIASLQRELNHLRINDES